MPANLENSAEATGLEKSVFIPVSKKSNAKEYSNYNTIALISHASRVMLKILQARLQQYMNQEFPDVQVGFRKGRGTRDQIANILWIIKKAREFQKNICFCFIDCVKAFDCVDHSKLENSSRDGTTRPPSVEFSSVTQSCPTLCDPMNRRMPGLPVHHQLQEFTQTQRPSSQ